MDFQKILSQIHKFRKELFNCQIEILGGNFDEDEFNSLNERFLLISKKMGLEEPLQKFSSKDMKISEWYQENITRLSKLKSVVQRGKREKQKKLREKLKETENALSPSEANASFVSRKASPIDAHKSYNASSSAIHDISFHTKIGVNEILDAVNKPNVLHSMNVSRRFPPPIIPPHRQVIQREEPVEVVVEEKTQYKKKELPKPKDEIANLEEILSTQMMKLLDLKYLLNRKKFHFDELKQMYTREIKGINEKVERLEMRKKVLFDANRDVEMEKMYNRLEYTLDSNGNEMKESRGVRNVSTTRLRVPLRNNMNISTGEILRVVRDDNEDANQIIEDFDILKVDLRDIEPSIKKGQVIGPKKQKNETILQDEDNLPGITEDDLFRNLSAKIEETKALQQEYLNEREKELENDSKTLENFKKMEPPEDMSNREKNSPKKFSEDLRSLGYEERLRVLREKEMQKLKNILSSEKTIGQLDDLIQKDQNEPVNEELDDTIELEPAPVIKTERVEQSSRYGRSPKRRSVKRKSMVEERRKNSFRKEDMEEKKDDEPTVDRMHLSEEQVKYFDQSDLVNNLNDIVEGDDVDLTLLDRILDEEYKNLQTENMEEKIASTTQFMDNPKEKKKKKKKRVKKKPKKKKEKRKVKDSGEESGEFADQKLKKRKSKSKSFAKTRAMEEEEIIEDLLIGEKKRKKGTKTRKSGGYNTSSSASTPEEDSNQNANSDSKEKKMERKKMMKASRKRALKRNRERMLKAQRDEQRKAEEEEEKKMKLLELQYKTREMVEKNVQKRLVRENLEGLLRVEDDQNEYEKYEKEEKERKRVEKARKRAIKRIKQGKHKYIRIQKRDQIEKMEKEKEKWKKRDERIREFIERQKAQSLANSRIERVVNEDEFDLIPQPRNNLMVPTPSSKT